MINDELLNSMRERAQRHLDGMTVNRDVMARDLLQLVDALRAERIGRAEDRRRADESDASFLNDPPTKRVFRGKTFDEALDKAFEAMDRDLAARFPSQSGRP